MESYGFLSAAQRKQVYATVIRGISDLVEGKDEAEEEGSKEIAMINASAFAFELIANFSVTPFSKSEAHELLDYTDDMPSEDIKKRNETSETKSKAAADLRKYREQVNQLINELDADFTVRDNKLAVVYGLSMKSGLKLLLKR